MECWYDANGCPREFEFSEKDRLKLFDGNLRKSVRISKRPLTARSRKTGRSSKSKVTSLNNSTSKGKGLLLMNLEKRRSIFDDMEGIQGHKRMRLIPTSMKLKSSGNNLVKTPQFKQNYKGNKNYNWNDINRFDFIWKDQPEYLSSYDNLTSKQTETSSRNVNIFRTK